METLKTGLKTFYHLKLIFLQEQSKNAEASVACNLNEPFQGDPPLEANFSSTESDPVNYSDHQGDFNDPKPQTIDGKVETLSLPSEQETTLALDI